MNEADTWNLIVIFNHLQNAHSILPCFWEEWQYDNIFLFIKSMIARGKDLCHSVLIYFTHLLIHMPNICWVLKICYILFHVLRLPEYHKWILCFYAVFILMEHTIGK